LCIEGALPWGRVVDTHRDERAVGMRYAACFAMP